MQNSGDLRFKGQVAIVTGGASGIGAGASLRLAREGARVVAIDLDPRRLESFAGLVGALPIETLRVDITNDEAMGAAFEGVAKRHGQLDVLVHSAGVVGPTTTKITEYTVADFRRLLDVNLTGAFIAAKHGLALMAPRNYGRMLLVASIAGKDGNPAMAGYTASKAGLIGLVKGLGKEWAKTGITINGLAPAVIRTPLIDDVTPEQLRYMEDRIPMGRLGTVEEVASVIAYAVSPEASFTTGFVFDASGGRAVY